MASVSWGLPAEEADPLEIDVYHGRYWFLPLWKLFLPPWKLIFYHHGSWFLPPWKVFLFLNGNKPITLTFYRETKINRETQCNGIKTLWNFISSSKSCQVQSLLKCHPAITDGPINCGFSELGVACRRAWSSSAHDWGAKQGEAEPTLEPADSLTVWLLMLGGNHWC